MERVQAGKQSSGVTMAYDGWPNAVGRSITCAVAGNIHRIGEDAGSMNCRHPLQGHRGYMFGARRANMYGQCEFKMKWSCLGYGEYPRITTNCAAHCRKLLFKDICGIHHFAVVHGMVTTIMVCLHCPTKIRLLCTSKFSKFEALRPDATEFSRQYIVL